MDWRKIEAALEEWARQESIDAYPLAGVWYLVPHHSVVNLTSLAKYLADNLKPEATK